MQKINVPCPDSSSRFFFSTFSFPPFYRLLITQHPHFSYLFNIPLPRFYLSSAAVPQMLDPTSATSPGGGDGKCTREGECVSLRVDLAVATQGLRLGVGVKVSSLEKALLPTGTVRLLEVFFRGSVAIRAELRKEFPFVGTVS